MNKPRRAIIVGGGIAGSALSVFLARAGVRPLLIEAYPKGASTGGAFQIAPNGVRVLAELDVADSIGAAGQPAEDMVFRNHRGRVIGVVKTGRAGRSINVRRQPVHAALRAAVEHAGIETRYEAKLVDIAVRGSEVIASLADGSTEVGDFLVGADGVHSRVRSWLIPDHEKPRDTGMISIGGLCAKDVAAPPDAEDATRVAFIVGPKHQLGYSKMSRDQWAWWCHVHPEDFADGMALMTMSFDALRDRLLERYRGWCAPSEDFISSTESWLRTAIHDVPRLPTWHRGRVMILGDAAHAMSPAGGQGASLALEDARAFSKLVTELPTEEAMSRFESLRRGRAEKIVAQGYANDRRSLREHGAVGMWMRDRVFMPMFSSFIERALHRLYTADANA